MGLNRKNWCVGVCQLALLLGGCGRVADGGTRDDAAGGSPPDEPVRSVPPATQPQDERFACSQTETSRPMLVARVDDGLYFSYRNAVSRRVYDFDVPQGGYVVGLPHVVARRSFVASYVVVGPLGGGDDFDPFVELVVLDLEGQVLRNEKVPFGYEGWGSDRSFAANDAGIVALTLHEVKTGLMLTVADTQTLSFEARFALRGNVGSDGWAVANDYEGSSSVGFSFFNFLSGELRPSAYLTDESANSSAAVVGNSLVYLSTTPPRLLVESASGRRELPLREEDVLEVGADGEPRPFQRAHTGWQRSGGWVLFHLGGPTAEQSRYLAAHPESDTVRAFGLAPPAGYTLPQDYWNPPAIDSMGRVLAELTTGDEKQLFATENGESWEALGQPLTASGYPATLVEAGGAVAYDGYGTDNAASGALPEYAAQVVGPQGGPGAVLDLSLGSGDNPTYWDYTLSPDGNCLAYFSGGSVHAVQTDSYQVRDLGVVSTTQSAELAWIPLE